MYHPLQHKESQLCILCTHRIYAFRMNLAINTAYFAKQDGFLCNVRQSNLTNVSLQRAKYMC
jgi:hypothetical protein